MDSAPGLAAVLLCLGLLGLASPVLSLQLESPRYGVTIEGPATETLPDGASAVPMRTLQAEHSVDTTSVTTHVSPDDSSYLFTAEQWTAATDLRTSDYATIDGDYYRIHVDRTFPHRPAMGLVPTLILLLAGAALTTAGAWIWHTSSLSPMTPRRALLAPLLGTLALGLLLVLERAAFPPRVVSTVQWSAILVLLAGVPVGSALAHRRWSWMAPLFAGSLLVPFSPLWGSGWGAPFGGPVDLPLVLAILAIPWFPFVATGLVFSEPFARFVGPVWGPLAERLPIEWDGPA